MGSAGSSEKARTIFERAIKKDPDYALYYFTVACCHAELGELDAALANLKLGFVAGRICFPVRPIQTPAPMTPSRSFLGDPKFEAAMKEMGFYDACLRFRRPHLRMAEEERPPSTSAAASKPRYPRCGPG